MGDLPRYLDGPKFVRWLEQEENVKFSDLNESQQRRWRDWQIGKRADLYGAADRILTDHHISISLIPDDCWSENQDRYDKKKTRIPRQESEVRRAEGRMLLRAGLDPNEVAKRLNVSPTTARNWARRIKNEDTALAA